MNPQMTMRSCIEEQPAVMQRIFENRSENLKDLLSYYKEICPDHLYIIACGSSYNASCAAAVFMEKALDIDVTVHVPSQIPTIRAKRPLILAVSQGGESTNTIAAVKALKNYPLVAVTGKKEHIYQAAMLEPHTAAELSIDDIIKMCDELYEAHTAAGYPIF